MPTGLVSFIWGAILTAIMLIVSGMLKAASTDLYKWLKAKIYPAPIEPIKVERNFQPEDTSRSYSWITEDKLFRLESEGYNYFLHPRNSARCYRLRSGGHNIRVKEWLMEQPMKVNEST